ncbi:CSG1/SUR1-like protein [Ciborinia camelliae]|nr:CSG1/SUR1-like protein [Ciborinia camelliae]
MRRGTLIFLVINFIIIGLLVNAFSTLISLLFTDGAADAIHRSEIPAPGSELIENRTQLIPKIIHQTYINSSIPTRWKAGQQSCIDLHEDYEYKLWTDAASREFIANEYPWFLDTFDSYPFPIQRADSIRYFVLAHYGGIYIDLDDGCNRRLDPLLSYPAWVRRTIPTGISNDAMGSVPQHPFFLRVIESLQSYNRNWGMPYITVMYSTGPLFLSVLWIQHMRSVTDDASRVRNLMPDEYNKHAWSFFNVVKGNSWHGKDAQTIFWMGKHWLLLTVAGFAVAGVVGGCLWFAWNMWVMQSVKSQRRGMALWRRVSGKDRYELLDRIA